MRFDREKVGTVNIIRVREKSLTSHEAPEMKTALLGLTTEEDVNYLMDMGDVENMDSTGLGSFLFGIRQFEDHDKDLRFCCVQSKVKFLIRIAHLEQVIELYENETEALAAFAEE